MIAITFALPSESGDLVRRLRNRTAVRCRGGNIILGKIGSRDLAIFHTGVGRKGCENKIEQLLHAQRPRMVISSGFAGAVTETLKVGDLIVAENFSDPGLLGSAVRGLGDRSIRTGKLFSSETIVDSLEERTAIAQKHGSIAIDMETEVIAEVCRAHEVPLLSLRVISDAPDTPLPLPAGVLFDLDRQKTDLGPLLMHLAKHPPDIWRLVRFARQIKRARRILTAAIVTVATAL